MAPGTQYPGAQYPGAAPYNSMYPPAPPTYQPPDKI